MHRGTARSTGGVLSGIYPGFWRIWVVFFASVLVAASVMNYLINPFSIYGTGFFEPYRENSYVEKAMQFEAMNPTPTAIVIGSSRVNSIDPELMRELTGKRCFNWGVPSAGMEVINAIIRLAREDYGVPVDMVIVGVDPDVLYSELWVHPQALLAPMYSKYLRGTGLRAKLKGFANSTLRLITMEQTSASLAVIRRELGDKSIERLELYRPDGFALYIKKEQAIEAGTYNLQEIIDNRLLDYPMGIRRLESVDDLPQDRKALWIDFLEYCRSNGIRVYAYLPPAHPRLLAMLERFGMEENLEVAAEFLEETVPSYGGVFRDFTMLDSFGGEPDQFYDEVHMRKQNNDRLLRSLLEDYNSPTEVPVASSNRSSDGAQ